VESAGRKAYRLAGRQAELREPCHALQTALFDVGMNLHGAGSRRRAAEEAVGHEFNEPDDLLLGLQSLIEMGAGQAIITREAGCVAILGEPSSRRRYEAEIDSLDPVATVGSGDAFLAGYVAARYDGGSAEECLAYGVACGAESTQHFGAGSLDREEVERLLSRVEVRELDVPAGVA